MQRHKRSLGRIGAIVSMVLMLNAVAPSGQPDRSGSKPQSSWDPKFYALCVGMPAARPPSVPQQADMLRQIGFDGVGYSLWFDEELDKNLRWLDDAGLQVYLLYTTIHLDRPDKPFDRRVPQAMVKLRGRPVTICVLLQGLPPGDARGEKTAIPILRQWGDWAAQSGLRISIYHHVNDWTESLMHTLQIVRKTDHPCVGANFNLCHWLKVDGDKDYRPVLRQHADKIFAVTINGARTASADWAHGLIQPLDRGDFDNRELLGALRGAGYRGPIGLMCYGIPDETRAHLQRSVDVWKTWQAEWGKP